MNCKLLITALALVTIFCVSAFADDNRSEPSSGDELGAIELNCKAMFNDLRIAHSQSTYSAYMSDCVRTKATELGLAFDDNKKYTFVAEKPSALLVAQRACRNAVNYEACLAAHGIVIQVMPLPFVTDTEEQAHADF